MEFIVIKSTETEVHSVITKNVKDENSFCLLTFDEDKNTHYFASDEEQMTVVKTALTNAALEFEDISAYHLHHLSPLYDKPKAGKRGYSFIGDADLIPFGINHIYK